MELPVFDRRRPVTPDNVHVATPYVTSIDSVTPHLALM